jgi:hypothetical protein
MPQEERETLFIEFEATKVGNVTDIESRSVAIGSDKDYLLLSRSLEQKDDCGIYLEYSDQINSRYECIKSCILNRQRIEVVLSKPIETLKGVEGFRVNLSVSNSEHEAFANGLRSIFRGNEQSLQIEA